jgi:hypothetical protein
MAAALLPSTATAAPDGSLYGLRLTGDGDCGTVKTAFGEAKTPYLFGPVRLLDGAGTPTGWLHPYSVTVVDGEGLKARHMLPGETFTRSGAEPANTVTCHFTGESREDGSFEIQITGTVRVR